MTPTQREAALRLVDIALKHSADSDSDISEETALLRELASEPVQEPVAWLSRDEARLALWEAIHKRDYGNPTDDKPILEALHKAGFWIGRLVTAEPQAEPVRECADNDSPWLICKPCAAVGRCAKLPVACQYAKDVAMPEHRCAVKCQYEAYQQCQPEAAGFGHALGAGRFTVVKGAFWWHIRIGDSTNNVGKFHSKIAAENMALKLLTAFRDGAYTQYMISLSQQRQPLTEDQIAACGSTHPWKWDDHVRFARAVERAHGITGGKE